MLFKQRRLRGCATTSRENTEDDVPDFFWYIIAFVVLAIDARLLFFLRLSVLLIRVRLLARSPPPSVFDAQTRELDIRICGQILC